MPNKLLNGFCVLKYPKKSPLFLMKIVDIHLTWKSIICACVIILDLQRKCLEVDDIHFILQFFRFENFIVPVIESTQNNGFD